MGPTPDVPIAVTGGLRGRPVHGVLSLFAAVCASACTRAYALTGRDDQAPMETDQRVLRAPRARMPNQDASVADGAGRAAVHIFGNRPIGRTESRRQHHDPLQAMMLTPASEEPDAVPDAHSHYAARVVLNGNRSEDRAFCVCRGEQGTASTIWAAHWAEQSGTVACLVTSSISLH